jgi:hypothetical protein
VITSETKLRDEDYGMILDTLCLDGKVRNLRSSIEAEFSSRAALLCIRHNMLSTIPAHHTACACIICHAKPLSEGLRQEQKVLNIIHLCICKVERLPGMPHDRFSLPAMVPMESTPLTSMPCGVCPVCLAVAERTRGIGAERYTYQAPYLLTGKLSCAGSGRLHAGWPHLANDVCVLPELAVLMKNAGQLYRLE